MASRRTKRRNRFWNKGVVQCAGIECVTVRIRAKWQNAYFLNLWLRVSRSYFSRSYFYVLFFQYNQEDCYLAEFRIKKVEHTDARNYGLSVENEKGVDKHVVQLTVRGSYTGKFIHDIHLSRIVYTNSVLTLRFVVMSDGNFSG